MKFKLNPKSFFYIMIGVLVILVLGGGTAIYFANTLIQKHSNQVVDLKLQSHVLDEQLTAYRVAKTNLTKYQDLQDLVSRVIPTGKDQARVVREIVTLANESGIQITSITFPTSSLGQAVAPTAAPATGTTTTTAPALPPITQASPVQGITGVFAVKTSVVPLIDKDHIVTYDQLINFLGKLELNRRTMQITNLTVTPQGVSTASGISFQLTVNLFVKP